MAESNAMTATGNRAFASEPAAIGIISAAEQNELCIKPLAEWRAESGDGLLLAGSDEPQARFQSAPVIAINFDAFSDGRGLSLAVLLRTRHGFRGELRAVGDVQPDLIHYMKRCGFDSFLLAGQSDSVTLAPYSNYYQASVLDPEPAFRRVRRGA